MVVLDQKLSPAKKMTGIIGIAEKGYTTLKLTATAESGHSSILSKPSTVGILAKAITALEENQMPSKLSGSSGTMFGFIGPKMGFIKRMLFANRWFFEDLIKFVLEKKKSTSAMIRTTTAVTMIKGGIKENVLPSHTSAIVNFKILPGNNSKDVMEHAQSVVVNPKVSIEFLKGAIFAPGLVFPGTDSKYYQ